MEESSKQPNPNPRNFDQELQECASENGGNHQNHIQNPNRTKSAGVKNGIIRRYGGMALALLTSITFSLDILLAKILQRYGFFAENSAFYRYAASPFLSAMFIGYYECRAKCDKNKSKIFDSIWPLKDPERRKTLFLVVIQGILAPANIILLHFAVEHITIADASVISSSYPIFISVLAHFMLGEKAGVFSLLAPVVAVLGVLLISKPPILTGSEGFDTNTLIGMAFASGSLICGSATLLIMRQQKEVHFTLMLFVRSIFGMGEAFIISQVSTRGFTVPHEFYDSILLAAIAMISFTSQMFFNLALQMETAALVSLVRSSDSIFTYLSQFVFLGVVPDLYSGLGGALIFICILTMGFRKYLMDEPKTNPCRKRCFFLLY